MTPDIPVQTYFNAEQAESLLFIIIGIIAILLAGYFLLKKQKPFYKGMAVGLIAIATIQLTVGTSIYLRSPKDIQRVTEIIQKAPSRIQSEEIPRMKQVMANFVVYRWIEITLLLSGVVLLFVFPSGSFWKGLSWGVLVQAFLMLALDFFAERRGEVYLEYLEGIG